MNLKSITFTIGNQTISINVHVDDRNLIHMYQFRPSAIPTTIVNPLEIDEFKKDVQFMLGKMVAPVHSGGDPLQYALTESIKQHIHLYGRLIINDLYTFLDELGIIYQALEINNGRNHSKDEMAGAWQHYYNIMIRLFKNQIWVSRPGQPQNMVRLSEII